jgi:hypothetical protein
VTQASTSFTLEMGVLYVALLIRVTQAPTFAARERDVSLVPAFLPGVTPVSTFVTHNLGICTNITCGFVMTYVTTLGAR